MMCTSTVKAGRTNLQADPDHRKFAEEIKRYLWWLTRDNVISAH
jgi:hypothetical protein